MCDDDLDSEGSAPDEQASSETQAEPAVRHWWLIGQGNA
jgi:hypothetical protein